MDWYTKRLGDNGTGAQSDLDHVGTADGGYVSGMDDETAHYPARPVKGICG